MTPAADATDPGTHRRRRRSVTRPAGPPSAAAAPALEQLAITPPADIPGADTTPVGGPSAADADDAASAEAEITAAADPVERSDRRRQRRQKAKRTRAERDAAAVDDAPPPSEAPVPRPDPPPAPDRDRRRSGSERALRGLEGGRDTQISTTDAMRARDWAAPTADDLAEADRDVVLVRRHYRPPAPLQTTRRRGGPAGDQDAGST